MSEEIDVLAEAPAAETITPPPEKVEAEKPEITEEAKPEGEPETEKPESEEDGEEPEKRKKPSGAERAKRRLQLATAELDRMARELEELKQTKQPAANAKPGVDREPTEADFPNDYFAYERAKTVWDTRQAVREEMNRERSSKQDELRREIQNERLEVYEESKTLARERIPDFDKVVNSAQLPITPELREEILASDKSALLQYHLAKNPDKVRELSQMNGRELAREIGRLEARIHLPSPKKATEATPPPSQPRGGAAQPVNLQTADMDTYVAQRRKEMASK